MSNGQWPIPWPPAGIECDLLTKSVARCDWECQFQQLTMAIKALPDRWVKPS